MSRDWSPGKNAANTTKHGLDFGLLDVFDWDTASVEADTRHHYGEVRLIAMGLIGVRVHVVVYTIRRTTTWIISLRKASQKEALRYATQNRDTD